MRIPRATLELTRHPVSSQKEEYEMAEKDRVRVAISMMRDDYEELKALADAEHETVSGYLRKALATERYIKEREQAGGKVLIEENGVQKEVVFR